MIPYSAEIRRLWFATKKAATDYQTYPNTACLVDDCDRLAKDGRLCNWHSAANESAAERMRALRARRKK